MKLFPDQDAGADWLASQARSVFTGGEGEHGYLADGPGLGKTAQACTAAVRAGCKRVLVIAPASALVNWRREWQAWGNRNATFAAVSYDALVRKPYAFRGGDWDVVIPDEAHYMKSNLAQRTLAALRVARQAPRAWLLSGTPMPNGPHELWTPLRGLWPGVTCELGIDSYRAWMNEFCHYSVHERYGPMVFGGKNLGRLKPYLKQIMLRRTEWQGPPLRIDVSYLAQDRALFAALSGAGIDKEMLTRRIEREEESEWGSHARLRRLIGEYKAPRIAEILADELKANAYRKIVVLAYHHSVLEILKSRLDRFGLVGFDGRTPLPKRQEAIDAFTNDSTVRVFLAQQSAAGVAINLQAAHEIALVEPSTVPDENFQAIKRIHRRGQREACRARVFAVEGTRDEDAIESCARKVRTQMELELQGEAA